MMRATTRSARRVIAAVLALGIAAGCTGSDDDGADADVPTTVDATTADDPTFEPVEGESDGTDDGFDPEVVDEALVPETVDEVVLDDDVIIATEDGQIPTTTTEPPPAPADTAPPDAAADATTTTVAPAPPPPAAEIARVVSLSPTHTETIAALGAADLLVGIDAFSDAPAGAPIEADLLVVDDLDVAQLRSLDVDLVVVGEDLGGIGRVVLTDAGVPFFDGAPPTSRAGVEQQILDLAAALGRDADGQRLVQSIRDDVAGILASVPASSGLTYFHEIDPGLATYTPGTLVDSLYGEFGLTSIVPASNSSTVFFPADDLLAANPDVVVLGDIDCCAATAERAAARSGWAGLSATTNGAIVEVPDDIANRFGINIVELMRLVAAGVAAAA